MISVPRLSFAEVIPVRSNFIHAEAISQNANYTFQRDTSALKNAKQRQAEEDKKKIKEIATAKKMPKPEKIEKPEAGKPKRQRRPDGLQRPPEIPRRND